MSDISGKMEGNIPSIILSSSTSLTVTATTQGVKHELIYSDTLSTAAIVEDISREIGVQFKEPFRKEITETIEITKTYISEVVISCKLKGGLKISFKWSPKKINKSFIGEQK